MKIVSLIFVICIDISSHAQDFSAYFHARQRADSLVAAGKYHDALPSLRACVSEWAMATMLDEFRLGYALFKEGKIDSASMYLMHALEEGFYFDEMSQVEHWQKAGVFEKFKVYPSLAKAHEMLAQNTAEHVSRKSLNTQLAQKLIAAKEKDQRYRKAGIADTLWARQETLDRENQVLLMAIIQHSGWPGLREVGYEASDVAWLIAQHADRDTSFQNKCLTYVQKAYHVRDVSTQDYAYLIDRTRVNRGEAQVFGTQYYQTPDGSFQPKPMIRPEEADLRRRVFNLEPLSNYLLRAKNRR